MKLLILTLNRFVMFALVFVLAGCMTSNVIHDAKAQSDKDSNGKQVIYKKADPVMYLFLPLSIPADIATSPFQAITGAFILSINNTTYSEQKSGSPQTRPVTPRSPP
jgi:hypothetical protein